MNLIIVSGNLCKPFTIKKSKGGKDMATSSIAVNHGKDRVSFLELLAFPGNEYYLNLYSNLQKGDRVVVSGEFNCESFRDKENVQKSIPKIVVRDVFKGERMAKPDFDRKPSEQPDIAGKEADDIPFG